MLTAAIEERYGDAGMFHFNLFRPLPFGCMFPALSPPCGFLCLFSQ